MVYYRCGGFFTAGSVAGVFSTSLSQYSAYTVKILSACSLRLGRVSVVVFLAGGESPVGVYTASSCKCVPIFFCVCWRTIHGTISLYSKVFFACCGVPTSRFRNMVDDGRADDVDPQAWRALTRVVLEAVNHSCH